MEKHTFRGMSVFKSRLNAFKRYNVARDTVDFMQKLLVRVRGGQSMRQLSLLILNPLSWRYRILLMLDCFCTYQETFS